MGLAFSGNVLVKCLHGAFPGIIFLGKKPSTMKITHFQPVKLLVKSKLSVFLFRVNR